MMPRVTSGSVLFLGKEKDAHTARAVEFCRLNFATVGVYLGNWDNPWPRDAGAAQWDFVISYLSRWIVPADMLERAKLAINFHPGPPEYPGYGCNNFAIYEGAKDYGVCCHHMAPCVDTGAIIATTRFSVLPNDDGGTLLARAYDYQLVLFYEVVARIVRGEELPVSSEKWTRKPFTRRQFDELGRITADMTQDEVARRTRATNVGALKPAVVKGKA
jgi:methionyl-tRNA formyltransferase